MGFVELNVWLDTVFVIIYVAVLLFLVFHFTLFVTTGRYKKMFKEGGWPVHEDSPPRLPKLLHFTHMFSMIILGITGMYIRFPFFHGGRIYMRDIHYVFMIIVIVVLFWRIGYAFWSKHADWNEFAIRRADVNSALGVLAYYGYFSNEKPHVAKYNILQKASYDMFLGLMFVQAFTGLALVTKPIAFGISPRQALVGWWLGALAGSTDFGGWGMRTIHYIGNWIFIIMTTIHLYIGPIADFPAVLDFFGIKPMQTQPGYYHHDHGEPHDDTPAEPTPLPQTAGY